MMNIALLICRLSPIFPEDSFGNKRAGETIRERGNNLIKCGPAEEAGLRVSGGLPPELSFAGPSGNNIGWLRLFFPVNSPNVRLL